MLHIPQRARIRAHHQMSDTGFGIYGPSVEVQSVYFTTTAYRTVGRKSESINEININEDIDDNQNNYHHHHHDVVLVAWISLTLSRHFSLSFIAPGRSSGQHPVSSHSCWMYVRVGRPAFGRPCVGVHIKH